MKTPKDLTLRDYFAAQILSGLLSAPHQFSLNGEIVRSESQYSELAYVHADALLREREK